MPKRFLWIGAIGGVLLVFVGVYWYQTSQVIKNAPPESMGLDRPPMRPKGPDSRLPREASGSKENASVETEVTAIPKTEILDDSKSTLENPTKLMALDNKHYFIFGQPQGQNSKTIKKIIFSLPGHGSTAEQDYAAWKRQITMHDYALASINWWDGQGETLNDYLSPEQVVAIIDEFLSRYGYTEKDIVVLEGFSRGSANTYSVKAVDVSKKALIDAVISASGKYQSDFAMTPELLSQKNDKMYTGVPWILACGEKDPNPTRDGCDGMKETQNFLIQKGATILGLLSDPNGAHGSFHQSPLNLADKALTLLDKHFGL